MHPKDYKRIFDEAKEKELEKQNDPIGSGHVDADIENALLNFIIKERLPLSKLESKHLNQLIQGSKIE